MNTESIFLFLTKPEVLRKIVLTFTISSIAYVILSLFGLFTLYKAYVDEHNQRKRATTLIEKQFELDQVRKFQLFEEMARRDSILFAEIDSLLLKK
ncbi:MAG: hypothetical protein WC346_06415 [Methanogenium sp.]|jgi:uncharacterized protein YpmB